jgi:hypothetical protein
MKAKQLGLELPIHADTPDTQADTGKHGTNGKTITIRWPAGSKFPTIRDKWKCLPDGRIEATYTQDELEQCRKVHELRSGM